MIANDNKDAVGVAMEKTYDDLKRGEKGAYLSIAAYLLLSAAKLIAGALTGSAALSADGLNNATDIAASVAVLRPLRFRVTTTKPSASIALWRASSSLRRWASAS